uniref:Calponin-homology (CH) domain-containing protein n=1 Tax=Electrophorus electricus TaxID=8005 RepID=A0AAY5EAT1_ELEEL
MLTKTLCSPLSRKNIRSAFTCLCALVILNCPPPPPTSQITGRSFGEKDFRGALDNGILLCELLSSVKPGLVKKINRLPTPVAGLVGIPLFSLQQVFDEDNTFGVIFLC